jgi:CHAD domain-containing protein
MRFSDFVAYHALQENNRCLHLLSVYPAPLSDNGVHSLRIGVKRLRASWRLLRREIPEPLFEGAEARLKAIHRVLAAPRDERALLAAVRSLGNKTTKKKTQTALSLLADALIPAGGSQRVTRAAMDQASAGFQQESSVWRDVDVEQLHDAALIAACVNCYRHGRRLGRRLLAIDDATLLHGWRRWVKFSFYQLDMVRPVLCAENRARRWYLDRLGDSLGKHNDLVLLRTHVDDVILEDDDRARIHEAIDARLTVYVDRARKLYPYVYNDKGRVFGAAVANDIQRLTFDNVVVLPRSA